MRQAIRIWYSPPEYPLLNAWRPAAQLVGSRDEQFDELVLTGAEKAIWLGRSPEPAEDQSAALACIVKGEHVSGTHCMFVWKDETGEWVVLDCESTNGTCVQDVPGTEPSRLEPWEPHPLSPGYHLAVLGSEVRVVVEVGE